jgi:hypothetical protein
MSIDRLGKGVNVNLRHLNQKFASFVKPISGNTTGGKKLGSSLRRTTAPTKSSANLSDDSILDD